ncbi:phosphatidate cytidylyltransferase [Taibaiella sp. KBW10]|uniref:phosphatidate cytidylyltransferase n=1 Tax=Taibaiella sp. KBW10 TaxID=2153357 RepID=UPI000F5B84CF|nr:phosphatidate cytidylyltransferase [Taibaiella sp. KBW10]RQO30334.1 phosphatidate cytidylyltransferase [Taibaiella sp. KBW10]
MNWPVFFTRLGSAIVFAALMMFGLLGHLWTHSVFGIFGLALLVQFLGIREFYRLSQHIFKEAYFPPYLEWVTQLLGLLVFVGINLASTGGVATAMLSMIPIILLFVAVLAKRTALTAGMMSLVGLVYVAVPMALLVQLWTINFAIPLALILMIWMNDTMAYIVGSFIGRTPFSPISPKKTWEGTIGGALLTIGGAAIWAHYTSLYHPVDWMALAACAAFAGTAGDLLESKLKRLAGIKDSGNIMPGHGGALDRFDSLLAALPFAFIYIMFAFAP